MKYSIFVLLLVSLLGVSLPAAALPILTPDRTLLSGVEVDGVLYDVTFGDGRVRDFYPESAVLAPGWSDFAIKMIDAIVVSLDSLGLPSKGSDIPGCSPHEGLSTFGIGQDDCFIYIPTYFFTGDNDYAVGDVVLATVGGARKYSAQIYGGADLYADTGTGGFTLPPEWVTLARISVATSTVPNPATWLLLLVALAGLQMNRKSARRLPHSHSTQPGVD